MLFKLWHFRKVGSGGCGVWGAATVCCRGPESIQTQLDDEETLESGMSVAL